MADAPDEVARIVAEDINALRAGNVKPTPGDIKCITYGHLIRLAIWSLRPGWNKDEPTKSRIARVADWLEAEQHIEHFKTTTAKDLPLFAVREGPAEYGAGYADVSF